MQTKYAADDLDLLVSGVCPECGEPNRLIQHDECNYECECGWMFMINGDDVIGSKEEGAETQRFRSEKPR